MYAGARDWLLRSGLFVSDAHDDNHGGVHSYYDVKSKEYGFLYPEITGYFISMLRFLSCRHDRQDCVTLAQKSADWLVKIHDKYGAIIQGVGARRSEISYSFDSAMCAKGMLDCYEIGGSGRHLDCAKKILVELSEHAVQEDGSVLPFRDVSGTEYRQSDRMWYTRKGCLHIKAAIPYFQLYGITGDGEHLKTASTICGGIKRFQNQDGSIRLHEDSKVINIHTLAYALEGLLYGFHATGNREFLEPCIKATEWCASRIDGDGGIPLWFNSRHRNRAAYPVAQLVRIMILLDKIGDGSHKPQIRQLYGFLAKFCASDPDPRINGGLYEELYRTLFGWKKRMRLNSWTTMFAVQAAGWHDDYDGIEFDREIKHLF